MKTNLRILGILLLGLFAISVVGCGREENPPPPEDYVKKLAGDYELIRFEENEDGGIIGLEPPAIVGTLVLVEDGPVYISIVASGAGYEDIRTLETWHATATKIFFATPTDYTLQGDVLTIITKDSDGSTTTVKWRKQ